MGILEVDHTLLRYEKRRDVSLYEQGLLSHYQKLTSRILLGEQLSHVLKGLELEGIPRRVQEEHGRLFPDLPLKADVRFDDKINALGFQVLREILEDVPRKDHPIVRHRYILAVYRIRMQLLFRFRFVVYHQLMPEEVEIDPVVAASPFGAIEHIAIKSTALIQVMDGNSHVKGSDCRHTIRSVR